MNVLTAKVASGDVRCTYAAKGHVFPKNPMPSNRMLFIGRAYPILEYITNQITNYSTGFVTNKKSIKRTIWVL